jgi:hypothetical protein
VAICRDPRELALDVSRALPPRIGVFRQARAHQTRECRRDPGVRRVDSSGLRIQNRRDNGRLAVAGERAAAGQHLVKGGTEGEHIAASVGSLSSEQLWRHVRQRAQHDAIARHRCRRR